MISAVITTQNRVAIIIISMIISSKLLTQLSEYYLTLDRVIALVI